MVNEFKVHLAWENDLPITLCKVKMISKDQLKSCYRFTLLSVWQIMTCVFIPQRSRLIQYLVCSLCTPFVFISCSFGLQRVLNVLVGTNQQLVATFSVGRKGVLGNLAILNEKLLFRLVLNYGEECRQSLLEGCKHVKRLSVFAIVKKSHPVARILDILGFAPLEDEFVSSFLWNRKELMLLLIWPLIANWAQVWKLPLEKSGLDNKQN